MKLSLYRRNFETNVPYVIVFNERSINIVVIESIFEYVYDYIFNRNNYGSRLRGDSPLDLLDLVNHYEFEDVDQLKHLIRYHNPELFL
jgi:hypothetical protein